MSQDLLKEMIAFYDTLTSVGFRNNNYLGNFSLSNKKSIMLLFKTCNTQAACHSSLSAMVAIIDNGISTSPADKNEIVRSSRDEPDCRQSRRVFLLRKMASRFELTFALILGIGFVTGKIQDQALHMMWIVYVTKGLGRLPGCSGLFSISFTSLHLSFSLLDHWGTKDGRSTTFLHPSLLSAFRRASPNFKPVHSVMLSSNLCFCLPFVLPP